MNDRMSARPRPRINHVRYCRETPGFVTSSAKDLTSSAARQRREKLTRKLDRESVLGEHRSRASSVEDHVAESQRTEKTLFEAKTEGRIDVPRCNRERQDPFPIGTMGLLLSSSAYWLLWLSTVTTIVGRVLGKPTRAIPNLAAEQPETASMFPNTFHTDKNGGTAPASDHPGGFMRCLRLPFR